MKIIIPALVALLTLSACGGHASPAENTADRLEDAADQSGPAAAAVLDNAADNVRDQEGSGVPGNADQMAQNALAEAGNAQMQSNVQ